MLKCFPSFGIVYVCTDLDMMTMTICKSTSMTLAESTICAKQGLEDQGTKGPLAGGLDHRIAECRTGAD